MRAIQVFAFGAIVLVGIYFVFRAIASKCVGAACDAYIPVSLLIPLLIVVAVAIAGALAASRARGSGWFPALLVVTVVGVAGPIAALLVFRDNPDAFVAVATVLELLAASIVLAYTLLVGKSNRTKLT